MNRFHWLYYGDSNTVHRHLSAFFTQSPPLSLSLSLSLSFSHFLSLSLSPVFFSFIQIRFRFLMLSCRTCEKVIPITLRDEQKSSMLVV